MKKEIKRFIPAIGFLIAFVVWTVLVCLIDLQAIGPQGSVVGFAGINGAFHKFTGVHMAIYDLTDLLSIIPLAIVAAFGLLGVAQWIKGKSLKAVDYDIWVLGGFYVVVMAVFLLFEKLDVNFRPILIEGVLEASYPSSTTMLAMCVLPTTMLQLNSRLKNRGLRICVLVVLGLFTAFMVIGRLISGVHWLTDIIGGALFSTGLLLLYNAFVRLKK